MKARTIKQPVTEMEQRIAYRSVIGRVGRTRKGMTLNYGESTNCVAKD